MTVLRRTFLSLTSLVPLAVALRREQPLAVPPSSVAATFPAHEPEVAREIVGVSHGNAARVRELLKGRPALANASWDWGYGDWESALGAASHVGNQEIARYSSLPARGRRSFRRPCSATSTPSRPSSSPHPESRGLGAHTG